MIEAVPTRTLSLGLPAVPAALPAAPSGVGRLTEVVTIDELPAGPVGLAGLAGLESAAPDGRARWGSGAVVQAAELSRALQGRGGAIQRWDASAGQWPAYSERSGRPSPGAVDVANEEGDILWLSG